MPRTVFFDMDDTLLDGIQAAQGAWAGVCEAFAPRVGAEATALREAIRKESAEFWRDESKVEREWRTRLHEARTLVVGHALTKNGWDPAPAEEISYRYAAEHRAGLKLFEDAVGTLERLREDGYRLGLLTNGPRELQRDKIERFELAGHFDVIVIEGEFGVGKPHPDVFAHALRTLSTKPMDAWHIGDNLYADIAGAQRSGIHAVWIHRERLELKDDSPAIPDRVIAHLPELHDALGS